ncbi:MAG: polysaccharide biosynthesis protein [Oscillospiraceae bacterium]|nr:polysaccharide biosynthesis protein [Oscillospiraceae bacterium]MDD4414966.1 polysaccharide biosynthesis protein [Oscillospiraceae bacterium]
MPQRNKQSFLQGALILSAAAILTKIIGALFFKIPLQKIDNTAYGYFAAAFNIYVPLYTVSTAGFPIAVSRMVSQSLALGQYRDVGVIHRVAKRVFLTTGTIGTLLMLLAAFIYPQFVRLPNTTLTMIVMAPSILFCCMISAYRGVYEGSRNMIPTAVSQIIEAVGKLIFGLTLAAGALHFGQWQFEQGGKVFGRHAETAQQALNISLPYISAGGMIGVTAGSFFSLAYLMIRYRRLGSGVTREELSKAPKPQHPRQVFRALLRFAIPVALGTLATQLTTLIDVVSLQKCLSVVVTKNSNIIHQIYSNAIQASKTVDVIAFLTANRDIAMTYVNLIPNITLSLGISALPIITSAWELRDGNHLRKMVSTVLRITLLISLPAGLGLSVMARPIMKLIYEPYNASVAGPQLEALGIAVIFICLVAPINAIFQAIGRADIPAKIVLAGGAVKLILNLMLVLNPRINIMGSAYSTLACYVVMVILSLYKLRRSLNTRIKWRSIFIKPTFAAICSSAAAWASNGLLSKVTSGTAATLSAIVIAVIVYIWVLLTIKAINRDDVLMLPKGQKIAQMLAKFNWIG